MSEQIPASDPIPEPILDTLRKAAILDATAANAKRQADDINETIVDLERRLAAAKKAHAECGERATGAAADAEHYRHMAYGRAATVLIPQIRIEAADQEAKDRAAPQPPSPPQISPDDPLNLTQLHDGQVAR